MDRKKTGRQGEDAAAVYLHQHDYQIIERNWRGERAEIDLIAQKGNQLVFIEVKTNRGKNFGNPEDRVDSRKQRQLIKAALSYLSTRSLEHVEPRFDVIAIELRTSTPVVVHFENAFGLESIDE